MCMRWSHFLDHADYAVFWYQHICIVHYVEIQYVDCNKSLGAGAIDTIHSTVSHVIPRIVHITRSVVVVNSATCWYYDLLMKNTSPSYIDGDIVPCYFCPHSEGHACTVNNASSNCYTMICNINAFLLTACTCSLLFQSEWCMNMQLCMSILHNNRLITMVNQVNLPV